MAGVTIITPSYQASHCIQQCMQSVWSAFSEDSDSSPTLAEHLILDGGSTDGTVEIAERFAAQHPHVRVISESDCGQSHAMNKGVRLARGEIIGFLNADDTYLPGTVAEAVGILETMPEPAFVCGNCRVVDAEGEVIHVNKPSRLALTELLAGAPPPWNPSAYFYHKSLHDRVGFYDEDDHYTMDLDFILRATAKIKLHYVDRDWGVFRWAAGGKTFDAQQVNAMEARKQSVIERHCQSLNLKNRLFVRMKARGKKMTARFKRFLL